MLVDYVSTLTAMSILLALIVVIYAVVIAQTNGESYGIDRHDRSTLVMSSVIFRHGDRTPDASSASIVGNNPWRNNTYPPFGLGELTLDGKQRSYLLGQELRFRFLNLLDNTYDKNLVEALTSSYNRCQMSLQAVLAGLFPPNRQWALRKGLDWQPVIYKTIPASEDNLISVFLTCPKILDLKTDFTQFPPELLTLYRYVANKTGLPMTSSIEMLTVQDLFNVQEELKFPVPDWIKPIWPKQMLDASLRAWVDLASHTSSYGAGNILKKIVADTKAKISGKLVPANRKLFLYSGHDLNVISVLTALGNYKGVKIKYASYVSIELHYLDGQYMIKTFLQNYDSIKPVQLNIPGCGEQCSLDVFERVVSGYYPPEPWCS